MLNSELIVVFMDKDGKETKRTEGDFGEVLNTSTIDVGDAYREFLRGKNNGFTVKRFDSKYVLVKELK